MNIFVLEPLNFDEKDLSKLKDIGNVHLLQTRGKEYHELMEVMPEVVFTRLGFPFDMKLIESLTSLETIVTCTTGLNHIDLDICRRNNICVLSLRGEVDFLRDVTSTAEHTWFLVLSILKQARLSAKIINENSWSREGFYCNETRGKTIGIIGFGRLGQIVAKYAQAFEMNVLINDNDKSKLDNINRYCSVSLEQLLRQADVVCLMASYSDSNYDLIGMKEFQLMKKGAIFVNTSRGEMVDEKALLKVLVEKNIYGAALDVLKGDSQWDEIVPGNHPLLKYAKNNLNLIITPHIGGHSIEAILKTRTFMVDKFLKWHHSSNKNY